ncbi:bifunctional riboflavin kinase/FAD synthetase [Ruania suaedae]|uniref:bifunctional riboflavin kinase/FAD synthetase n=1 Tax=Ruania suaedae TaxID=2897774 RepID=UPI001E5270CB|nr:bifunctional riboflavin kinase/FAD synthetase [Ruania suaedae]UFU04179.1 bifunctional riboflavin kinase/FAD synthetase [Ruania suaedae]
MERWFGIEQVPADMVASVVTIGNFDGVHLGHRAVLAEVVDAARGAGAPAVAVTFDPHPAAVHRPAEAPELLTGLTDRLDLIAETGIDATLVIAYSTDFAAQTPEEFVRRTLVDTLRVRRVVVGEDVRFGRGNSGDRGTMVALGERLGFGVQLVRDVSASGQRRWSSTWVRELLAAGDCAGAAAVLGRAHRMRGAVVHGEARGRRLGFPTANLAPDATGTVPADGVYAGWLWRDPARVVGDAQAGRLPAAVSIGTNPTFDGTVRQVEAHVLGRRDLDLYGEEVVVEFVRRLRPTVRYDGIESLVEQMRQDVIESADVLQVPRPDLLPALPG